MSNGQLFPQMAIKQANGLRLNLKRKKKNVNDESNKREKK